jgi:hypothetical protein
MALFGCGSEPSPRLPVLSVEKRVEVKGAECFAPCEGSAAAPPAADTCKDATEVACGVEAGLARLRVSLDYGKLELTTASDVVWPSVDMLADSAALKTLKLAPGPIHGGLNEHVYGFAEIPAPTERASSLLFQAQLGGGEVIRSTNLTVTLSQPRLELPGCGQDCTRPAQVGRQAISVSIAGGLPATSAFVTTTLGGVPDPTTLEIPLDTVADDERSGTRWLNVPDVVGTWTLQARVGEQRSIAETIDLTTPGITAALQPCMGKMDCKLTAGTSVSVLVTAPKDTLVTTASVVSYVGGTLTGDAAPAALAVCENNVKCGFASLVVPKTGVEQTFRAVAFVGSFDKSTELAVIQ